MRRVALLATVLAVVTSAALASPDGGVEPAENEAANGGAEAAVARVDPAAVVVDPAEAKAAERARDVAELCALLTSAARRYKVPQDFFIRLIWKESRFNAGAVSPVGAQGIAQFMPGTARIRGLKNPFDREEALHASASFLADLEARFGSWGLAAMGYNGGPNRVPAFVQNGASLPYETVDYVYAITGRTVNYWRSRAKRGGPFAEDTPPPAVAPPGTGRAMTAAAAKNLASLYDPPVDAGLRIPLARPLHEPLATDCPQLVARLGRDRDIAPPSGGGRGWTRWGAQVAGHPKRAVAMSQYARLKSRLPSDLVARGPTVVTRRFAARGRLPIHAVMFSAANQSEAKALCRRIAKALAPCVVVKNG